MDKAHRRREGIRFLTTLRDSLDQLNVYIQSELTAQVIDFRANVVGSMVFWQLDDLIDLAQGNLDNITEEVQKEVAEMVDGTGGGEK